VQAAPVRKSPVLAEKRKRVRAKGKEETPTPAAKNLFAQHSRQLFNAINCVPKAQPK